MRLKILFVPVVMVLILIVIILYIKPDYAVLQAKRADVSLKEDQVAKMETVINNVNSLESDLNSKKDSEDFLTRYFPQTVDSDRIVDALNFLAEQSGVVLATISIVKSETQSEEPLFPVDPAALTTLNPAFMGEGGVSLPPGSFNMPVGQVSAPLPEQVMIKISAEGTYPNLKSFMSRVSHMDRANSFQVLQLKEKGVESEGELVKDLSDPLLSGTFEIWMDFVPQKHIESALSVPTFWSPTYDISPLESLKAWITSPVPVLQGTPGGKSNPFEG